MIVFIGWILISCNPDRPAKLKEITKPAEATSVKDKVVMAVFAHPDDELTVGPILSKYAREGAKVHLITVTDGRYGTGQTDFKVAND